MDIVITFFELRPFGITCEYRSESVANGAADHFDVMVVMKDGNEIQAQADMGGIGQGSMGAQGYMNYNFDAPLLLENVAYVLLQNGRDELRLTCPSEYSPTEPGTGEEATAPTAGEKRSSR